MQVTDEEVELCLEAWFAARTSSPGGFHLSQDKLLHIHRDRMRAAIAAYTTTEGQVRMREDAERYRLSQQACVHPDVQRAFNERMQAPADAARATESKP